MKRDLYIDVVKGFATLSIIFIHTVFWSGQFYVPSEVRRLSLLIDVPVFFFLSGLTSSGKIEKNIIRLTKLQITYIIFVTQVFIITSLINQNFNIQTLGNWWIHNYSSSKSLDVVMGSTWYLKIYFIMVFFGVLALRFCNPKQIKVLIFTLLMLYLYFCFINYPKENIGYVIAYLIMFLTASQIRNYFIPKIGIIIGYGFLLIISGLLYLNFGNEIFVISMHKFPPDIIYFSASLYSLFTIMVLKGRLKFNKSNFLTYVGQNAIFYYFAQGISSSILYLIVNQTKDLMPWYLLLPITFTLNVLMAMGIAEILKKIDAYAWDFLNYLRKKIV